MVLTQIFCINSYENNVKQFPYIFFPNNKRQPNLQYSGSINHINIQLWKKNSSSFVLVKQSFKAYSIHILDNSFQFLLCYLFFLTCFCVVECSFNCFFVSSHIFIIGPFFVQYFVCINVIVFMLSVAGQVVCIHIQIAWAWLFVLLI